MQITVSTNHRLSDLRPKIMRELYGDHTVYLFGPQCYGQPGDVYHLLHGVTARVLRPISRAGHLSSATIMEEIMTLEDIRKEAEPYGLEIEIDGDEYVILLDGDEIAREPKSISMHKLADVLANAVS